MRTFARSRWMLLLLVGSCAALCRAAPPADAAHLHPTRRDLFGAWQLVSIEYSGMKGPAVDPFYQAGSTGLLIYEASGWMSVHIVAPHRRGWEIPASRLSASQAAQHARSKTAAFDSYYAYFGTWDLDERTSVVAHHVRASLIPAESGLDYTQTAALEGGRLVLTTHSKDGGDEFVRRKVWERTTAVQQR